MRETVDQLDLDVVGEPYAGQSLGADGADVHLPSGVGAKDDGSTVGPDVFIDEGFGELERPATEDERLEIPRQPTGDDAESQVTPGRAALEATVATPYRASDTDKPEKDTPRVDLGEIPEAELQKSPHYQRLVSEGRAGAALMPYLHRLTISKDDAPGLAKVRKHIEGDSIDKGLVDRLGDEGGAPDNYFTGQLTGILDHSLTELQEHPELTEGDTVNWLGLSTALLDRADAVGKQPDFSGTQAILSSAVTAAMMSENPDDRITFLEETASRNLRHQVARALNQSEVSIVQGGYRDQDVSFLKGPDIREDRTVQRLRSFGTAFRATPEDVARYRELTERDFDAPGDAHSVMKDAITDYADPDIILGGGNAEELEDASVAPKDVDKYRIDPTKAERFALQEVFVKAQVDELFPDGDPSSFGRALADQRPGDGAADGLARLRADTQKVMGEMSQGAAKRFHVPQGTPSAQWTREQLAAWRYGDLVIEAAMYDDLVKFVDPTVFGRPSNIRADIYTISQTGAALPDMAVQAMKSVMQMADQYETATGDRVSPEEVRDLLQGNRRQLMKLAAINGDNLAASFVSGSIGTEQLEDRQRVVENSSTIERRQDGTLTLNGPIFHPDKASSHSAARLACVALRVNVEEKPEGVDDQKQKINSIELLSRIMIDEAYERGVFKAGLAQAA